MNVKMDHDSNINDSYSKSVLKTLYRAYKPFLLPISLSLFLGIVGRFLILGQSNLIGMWVDKICAETNATSSIGGVANAGAHSSLFFSTWSTKEILWLLLAMGLLGFLLTAAFRIIFSTYSAYAVSSIYDRVTLRTSRFPMNFFDQNPTGKIITRFSSDYGTVFRLFGGPLAEFGSIIFDIICIIVLLITASYYNSILLAFIFFLNYLIYRLNIFKLRKKRRKLSASRAPSIAHFAETTQGSSTIRILGKESFFKNRFNFLDQFYLKQKLSTVKEIFKFSFQMNSISSVQLFFSGVGSYYLMQSGKVSPGAIGASFGLIVYSGNTVQMFFEWLSQLEEGMIGVERLDNYLRKPIEHGQNEDHLKIRELSLIQNLKRGSTQSLSFNTNNSSPEFRVSENLAAMAATPSVHIKFNDLWFRYDQHLPWILKGLNFEIHPKEKIGIVGRTGSGKTSLIQTLFGFYPYQKGAILLNGMEPIKDLDINLYRQNFAYISQEPVLFMGTLRDNLDPESLNTDETLLESLNKVGFTNNPSDKTILDLKIEEKGKNLSLGERQLLCLARTLIQKCPVVILDEATSSVDPQSEEIMVRATEDFFKDRSQIIIAHRLTTLSKCDKIIWLEKGEIKKIGPPDTVIPEFEMISTSPNMTSI